MENMQNYKLLEFLVILLCVMCSVNSVTYLWVLVYFQPDIKQGTRVPSYFATCYV